MKPTSGHDPKIMTGAFKGFVHRALKICSENYIEQELEFLVNVFIENGYQESNLRKIINDVRTKLDRNTTIPANDNDTMPTISLPWIPGVSPKLRKVFKKAGYKVAFKSSANLKTILTAKNKVNLPKNSHPGVYMIPCACKKVPPYIGQTKLKVCTRSQQHDGYVKKGQWDKSGIAAHAQTCPEEPLFSETKTIKVEHNTFNRRVREALEIQKFKAGPKEGGINKDEGMYVTTKFWLPFLRHLHSSEEKRAEQRQRRQIQNDVTSTSNNNEVNIGTGTEENLLRETSVNDTSIVIET